MGPTKAYDEPQLLGPPPPPLHTDLAPRLISSCHTLCMKLLSYCIPSLVPRLPRSRAQTLKLRRRRGEPGTFSHVKSVKGREKRGVERP